jgi:uncharacterized protein (TIGR02996 family)
MERGWLMDNYNGLLKSIIDYPDEDTPRLMFADLLEEQGDTTRSEFIKIQIKIAKLTPPLKIRGSFRHIRDTLITAIIGNPGIIGTNYDLEIITSRVSATTHKDVKLINQVPLTEGYEALFRMEPSWEYRRRYEDLLDRQHHLTWYAAKGHSPWFDWAFVPYRDEDGRPTGPGGRGGMTVHPAHWDQFPEIEVSPCIKQTFRRGFVDEVLLGEDVFVGGPCDMCQGASSTNCSECHNKGRISGIGKALLQNHPIQNITLRDKRPIAEEGGGDYRFWRDNEDYPNTDSWIVAAPLFDSLPHAGARFVRDDYLVWETEEAAIKALSAACIRYGRGLVGVG